MTVRLQQLEELVKRGVAADMVAFFRGATETERQPLAKTAEKLFRERSQVLVNPEPEFLERIRAERAAARVAVLAACPYSTVKSLGWRLLPLTEGPELAVILDRRPAFLQEWAEHLLAPPRVQWQSVRLLLKHKLIQKPSHDYYVLGMTHIFAGVGSRPFGGQPGRSVLEHLESEPDLLEDIWRLFELEGDGEYSLAAHDKFSGPMEQRWDGSLVELSRRGRLPRERLLDASLAALDRGFAQFRVAWFSSFHELLEPTADERASRADQYLRLLASPIGPTVTYALDVVSTLDQAGCYHSQDVLAALQPAMTQKAKSTVKTALKLVERIGKRDPECQSAAARVAAEALIHEASDVQSAAVALLEQFASPQESSLRDTVQSRTDLVAPSVRARIEAWLQTGSDRLKAAEPAPRAAAKKTGRRPAPATAMIDWDAEFSRFPAEWRTLLGTNALVESRKRGAFQAPALQFEGTEFPRLDSADQLPTLESVDALIDHAAAVVESFDSPDAVEQLFDGISRLCLVRPDDFARRTGPLVKRIHDLIKRQWMVPFIDQAPESDIMGVLLAWLTGDSGTAVERTVEKRRQIEFSWRDVKLKFENFRNERNVHASSRARALRDRILSGTAVGTLCAPTHRGGWLDPRVLVQRLGDPRILENASDFEKALALLRLAPDGRDAAHAVLPRQRDEFVSALRYALGGKVSRIGASGWLWAAAARARTPFHDDRALEQTHPGLGPDAARAASPSARVMQRQYQQHKYQEFKLSVEPPVPAKVDPRLLTVAAWKTALATPDRVELDSSLRIGEFTHLWPLGRELMCAAGAHAIGGNLDWIEARWHHREFLVPLLDPDQPLRPMALLLLVLGLAARESAESGLATDIAIAAIDDGRLDSEILGQQMAELMPTHLITLGRWAKTLQTVSKASALHAEVVRRAIARSLRGKPDAMPKDLHALVELLKELAISSASDVDVDTREFLKQIQGTGKLAKAAKLLIGLKGGEDSDRLAAVQEQVLQSRLVRLRRWQSRL